MIFGTELSDTGPLSSIFSLAVIMPTITAAARRLHDTNRSDWWQLVPLAPTPLFLFILPWIIFGDPGIFVVVISVIVVIVMIALVILLIFWLASRGTEGLNKFGEDPLGDSIADVCS